MHATLTAVCLQLVVQSWQSLVLFVTCDTMRFVMHMHVINWIPPNDQNACLAGSVSRLACFIIFCVLSLHVYCATFYENLVYVSNVPRVITHSDMSTSCHSLRTREPCSVMRFQI